MTEKFLGRTLDVKTMTYSFGDGSGGALPMEMKYDVDNARNTYALLGNGEWTGSALFVFGTIWSWKKRLGIEE